MESRDKIGHNSFASLSDVSDFRMQLQILAKNAEKLLHNYDKAIAKNRARKNKDAMKKPQCYCQGSTAAPSTKLHEHPSYIDHEELDMMNNPLVAVPFSKIKIQTSVQTTNVHQTEIVASRTGMTIKNENIRVTKSTQLIDLYNDDVRTIYSRSSNNRKSGGSNRVTPIRSVEKTPLSLQQMNRLKQQSVQYLQKPLQIGSTKDPNKSYQEGPCQCHVPLRAECGKMYRHVHECKCQVQDVKVKISDNWTPPRDLKQEDLEYCICDNDCGMRKPEGQLSQTLSSSSSQIYYGNCESLLFTDDLTQSIEYEAGCSKRNQQESPTETESCHCCACLLKKKISHSSLGSCSSRRSFQSSRSPSPVPSKEVRIYSKNSLSSCSSEEPGRKPTCICPLCGLKHVPKSQSDVATTKHRKSCVCSICRCELRLPTKESQPYTKAHRSVPNKASFSPCYRSKACQECFCPELSHLSGAQTPKYSPSGSKKLSPDVEKLKDPKRRYSAQSSLCSGSCTCSLYEPCEKEVNPDISSSCSCHSSKRSQPAPSAPSYKSSSGSVSSLNTMDHASNKKPETSKEICICCKCKSEPVLPSMVSKEQSVTASSVRSKMHKPSNVCMCCFEQSELPRGSRTLSRRSSKHSKLSSHLSASSKHSILSFKPSSCSFTSLASSSSSIKDHQLPGELISHPVHPSACQCEVCICDPKALNEFPETSMNKEQCLRPPSCEPFARAVSNQVIQECPCPGCPKMVMLDGATENYPDESMHTIPSRKSISVKSSSHLSGQVPHDRTEPEDSYACVSSNAEVDVPGTKPDTHICLTSTESESDTPSDRNHVADITNIPSTQSCTCRNEEVCSCALDEKQPKIVHSSGSKIFPESSEIESGEKQSRETTTFEISKIDSLESKEIAGISSLTDAGSGDRNRSDGCTCNSSELCSCIACIHSATSGTGDTPLEFSSCPDSTTGSSIVSSQKSKSSEIPHSSSDTNICTCTKCVCSTCTSDVGSSGAIESSVDGADSGFEVDDDNKMPSDSAFRKDTFDSAGNVISGSDQNAEDRNDMFYDVRDDCYENVKKGIAGDCVCPNNCGCPDCPFLSTTPICRSLLPCEPMERRLSCRQPKLSCADALDQVRRILCNQPPCYPSNIRCNCRQPIGTTRITLPKCCCGSNSGKRCNGSGRVSGHEPYYNKAQRFSTADVELRGVNTGMNTIFGLIFSELKNIKETLNCGLRKIDGNKDTVIRSYGSSKSVPPCLNMMPSCLPSCMNKNPFIAVPCPLPYSSELVKYCPPPKCFPPSDPCPPCPGTSPPITICSVETVGSRSLLINWKTNQYCGIVGYEVYVDCCLKCRRYSPTRTSALVYGVDLKEKHVVTVSAITDGSLRCFTPIDGSYCYQPGDSKSNELPLCNCVEA